MNALHSSVTNEHYTPKGIIDAARAVMGGIDLDPASCPVANEVVGADRIFTIDDDGLKQEWHGRVFLNPPGGQGQAKRWWHKLANEWFEGRVTQAVFLGFSLEILQTCQVGASDTDFHPLDFPFCIPKRRLAFDRVIDGERVAGKNPTHANIIVYLSSDEDEAAGQRFAEAFGAFGYMGLSWAL